MGVRVDMEEIWTVAEGRDGRVHEATLEILGEARRLADGLRYRVAAVLMGGDVAALAQPLAAHGADLVYLVQHPLLAEYSTGPYTAALSQLARRHDPWLIALAATQDGSDLAARLAARLRVPLAAGCTALKLNKQKQVEATRPIHGDRVYGTLTWKEGIRPLLATLRPGAIGVEKPRPTRTAEVVEVALDLQQDPRDARPLRFVRADPVTVDLAEADLVIAGGRGVGSAEDWRLIEELAGALGASVGGTRVARDLGWIPLERLVGQTGKTVKPKLYVAAGISGASQHLQGMKDAERIIVINKDRAAPIFKLADVAVIADLRELLPALAARLRAAREEGDSTDARR